MQNNLLLLHDLSKKCSICSFIRGGLESKQGKCNNKSIMTLSEIIREKKKEKKISFRHGNKCSYMQKEHCKNAIKVFVT